MADAKEFFGEKAVREVQKLNPNIILNEVHKHIIRKEGYVAGEYSDVGKIATGVGQTGKCADLTFLDCFAQKEDLAKQLIPVYSDLTLDLQKAIMSGVYRGDLSGSPKTLNHINQNNWDMAAEEFLDNNEYRNPDTPKGVKIRMEEIADTFKDHGVKKRYEIKRGNPNRENFTPDQRLMYARAIANG
jgi:hypothetical protein|tara:strand:- start:121 stop:681 length:561 start_codon:yes stop_codon:yes gene_type:complete